MNLAPIVLFVYNRPEHTRKTLEALKINDLASESILYIYADGAKENASEIELDAITRTRKVIKEQEWCGKVHIIESKVNKGLAASITEGVTEIVEKYRWVIVLEDDIVTSTGFLVYMNDALKYYEMEDKVMHISGYFPPIKKISQKFFFYNQTSCWGWATWSSSWVHYDSNATKLYNQIITKNRTKEFNLDNSYPFLEHLENNISGLWNTWAVKWHASVFLLNGLCLHPNQSYTENIGFDGSGVHCFKIESKSDLDKNLNKSYFEPVQKLVQSKSILKKVIKFNKKQNKEITFAKVIKRFKKIIS
ncbi:glycosyltransferase family 2 protein [Nonlabens sp.]|uniref:glycosyltransferase family 2 protein n=1 Tax=Nonlabens sp. TaxID=1888209 RepID=UPI001BCD6A64|nr:glycosyltransferase [Nonlabens sp.]